MKNFKIGQRWRCRNPGLTGIILYYRESFYPHCPSGVASVDIIDNNNFLVSGITVYASSGQEYADREDDFDLISRIPDIEYCQEGDILKDENSFIKIIGRAGNVFFVTQWAISVYDISDSDIRSISLDELKAWKVKLYLPEEPNDSITLSKQQIAEKFGCDVSQLKIED